MKIYKYSLILVSVLFLFACEKETEGISRVTFYTDLQLKGPAEMSVKQGEAYVEPGYIAIENDEDVTDKVQVNGSVNTNTPGAYRLSYVATNLDGFKKTVDRLVFVVPSNVSTADVTGTYKGQRVGRAEAADACVITSLSNGVFKATDFFGGFYNLVVGYGSAYRLLTYFYITPDNEVKALSTNSPWGPWEVRNGIYKPLTNVFTHTVYQDGFSFNVILTKQ
ncbi:BT_2262 family domain-containing protein [Proteiniphilum sp. UBA5384]|uniref:BT_2262 family domain-containing protein n=1 Tax=Proteiniphilum sp. UBA5384 TaxID=1947279 RepID=UPI0025EABF75|nr:BT_2262 family domain-containing protein [Proteiniphilum sp. UBA5384]